MAASRGNPAFNGFVVVHVAVGMVDGRHEQAEAFWLLLQLLHAAGVSASLPAADASPHQSCAALLRSSCSGRTVASCQFCTGRAQHVLRAAGCSSSDVAAFCSEWPSPPQLDSVAGEWQRSDIGSLWNNSNENMHYWQARDLPVVTNFWGSVGTSLPETWGGYYQQCFAPVPVGCPRDLLSFQSLEVAPFTGAGAMILRVNGVPPPLEAVRWLPHTSLRRGSTSGGVSITTAMTLQLEAHALLYTLNITSAITQSADITIDAMAMAQKVDWQAAGFFFHTPEDPARFTFSTVKPSSSLPPILLGAADKAGDETLTATSVLGDVVSLKLNTAGRGGKFVLSVATPATVRVVVSIGNSSDVLLKTHHALTHSTSAFDGAVAATVNGWEYRWRSAFTPLNTEYSGSLPTLHPANSRLARLYYASVLSVLSAERRGPYFSSVCRRWWVVATGNEATVPTPNNATGATGYGGVSINGWDTSMAATTLALLDPDGLRSLLAVIVSTNDTSFCVAQATDASITSCSNSWNALSAFRLLETYTRVTNDTKFLHQEIAGSTPLHFMRKLAWSWQQFVTPSNEYIVDYSADSRAYLEVVDTYVHACAAHQAQFIDMMRKTADVLEWLGANADQASLRTNAEHMLNTTLNRFYLADGTFACLHPDGNTYKPVSVRTSVDTVYVGLGIATDLGATRSAELIRFVRDEIAVSGGAGADSWTWVRALSTRDKGTGGFVFRPDWGTTGAFGGWGAAVAEAMGLLGDLKYMMELLDGISFVAREGALGQAYSITKPIPGASTRDDVVPPFKPVYGLTRFHELGGGYAADAILRTVFGLQPPLGWRCDNMSECLFMPSAPRGSFEGTLSGVVTPRGYGAITASSAGVEWTDGSMAPAVAHE